MANDYKKPFDGRLCVGVLSKTNNNPTIRMPFSNEFGTITNGILMPIESLTEKLNTLKNLSESDKQKIKNAQEKVIERSKKNETLKAVPSLINPYAMTRLAGSINRINDENYQHRLIDSSIKRPWYEMDSIGAPNGYSKYPTTSAIIEWGKTDTQCKTPYQFQDFVFCKWWNKIPNNRLITLRRYAMPILDNLSIPTDDNFTDQPNLKFPPLATAITYFGEQTGNSLKDILKFSTGMNWGDTSANVWDVEGDDVSSNEAMEGAGNALGLGALFGKIGHALNGLSILDNRINEVGFIEGQGLPPDPYQNGPYENRIKGPVNRIDSVKKRDAGLKFEMSGLKIKFDYIGRPIGGINTKAVLLDILSNFMLMGSASAVFFGGAHRFRVKGRRFPAFNHEAIKKWYAGDLEGGITDMFEIFSNAAGAKYDGNNFIGMIMDVGKELWSDLMNMIGNPFGKPSGATTKSGKNGAEGIKTALMQKMHKGMRVPYLTGMRALLIGEPVGEWHLTIGNPMNPIAMIGNLICTNIEVEFDEDAGLGPDDFPLGFSVTVSLDHGMPRDRDAIESMFNKGTGRIYEVPEGFIGSADKESNIDNSQNEDQQKGSPVAARNEYITTETSLTGLTVDLVNSKSTGIESRSQLVHNNIYNNFDFSSINSNDILSRVPTIATIDWIIEKGLK